MNYSSDNNIYSIKKAPKWINEKQINLSCQKIYPDSPYYYLLVDYQDRITNEAIYTYSRTVQKINDSSRIEEASLYITELNKSNQHIIFHSLDIIRNQERINVLELTDISVMQRERSLENHITNNRLTVSLSINDLREGDIIDYQTTFIETAGEHPFQGKHYFSTYWLQWNCPVLIQYIRVINNSASSISYLKSIGQGQELELIKDKIILDKEYEEVFKKLTLVDIEPTAPNWVWPDFIQLTTTYSWKELSSYLFKYYSQKDAFKNTIKLHEIELLELSDDLETNIINIIRFVQNKIRYKGENHGIYSHTPKSPDKILEKRAGDCKDKSNLLVALLKKIGVKASLVLVSLKQGTKIKDLNPSAYHFDHMIVRIDRNDKSYYFDPTIQKQAGNFETSAQLDYGFGLKLSESGEGIVKLPYDLSRRVFTLRHEFDFKNLKEKAMLKITREFLLHRADNIRSHFYSNEKNKIEDEYFQWAKEESDIELKVISPMSIVDDNQTKNSIKTQEIYEICNLESTHKDKNIELLFNASIADFTIPNKNNTPVQIDLDGEVSHTIIVDYYRAPELFPSKEEISNKYFKYLDTVMLKGNKQIFVSILKSHVKHIEPEDIKEYTHEVEKIRNRSVCYFTYKSSSFVKDNYFEWLSIIISFLLMYFLYYFSSRFP